MRVMVALAVTLAALASARAARAEEPSPGASAQERDRAADLDAERPTRARFAMRASAAGGSRALFDSYLLGAGGQLGAGVDTPVGSFTLLASVFGGVVEGGFTTVHGAVGFDADWPIGLFRLGLGPRIGYLGVDRLTTERQFGAYTFGLAGRASVDVMRDRGVALALGVRPTVDVAAALGNDGPTADSAAPLLGGDAFLEVRWRRVD